MKKWLIFFLLMSISSLAVAKQTVIHFATEATYPPFEYIDEHGNITGFDIDIAKALCKDLNAVCQFSNQSFNGLMPSLNLGKFDAVIAALGVTPEREKEVDFTTSYYQPSASFLARSEKNNTQQYLQLNHHIIGVQQGSTFEKFLQDKYQDKVQIKSYMSIQDAFLDLNAERVDMVLTDTPIGIAWLKDNKNHEAFNLVGASIQDEQYFGSGYAIAVKKNNVTLLKNLNTALAHIKANGEFDQISKKYFSAEEGNHS